MRDRLPLIFSTTALLVAVLGVTPLGEAAYNQVVPRNSVGTLQLQRNAVKAAKIAPNAVRTAHVLDGSLLTADFKAGQIPQGPKGDKGEQGPAGPTTGAATNSGGGYTDVADVGPSIQVTLATAGRIFVFGRVQAHVTCGVACNRHYEVYVDGARVPGTLAEVHVPASTSITEHATTFGVVSATAGTHTVRLRASNSTGVTAHLDVLPNVGAIVLGGS